MRQEIKEMLQSSGIDVDEALKRLMGNEEFYFKILEKFKEDTTADNFKKAAKEADWEEVLHELHTLKGVAANLGMSVLMEKAGIVVEMLRRNELEGIEKELKEIVEAYEKVMCAIEELSKGRNTI